MLRRPVKWIALAFFVAILVTLGLAGWLLYSESGARWSVSKVDELTAGAVRVDGVEGTWKSGIRIAELVYSDPSIELTANDVRLRIDRIVLASRDIHIESLAVGQFSYLGKENPDGESDSDGSFSLPVSLFIPDASVDRFVIRGDTDEIVDRVRLAVTWEQGDTIAIERAEGRIRDIDIDARGSIVLARELLLAVEADWAMTLPDGMRFEGSGSGTGGLKQLEVDHQLSRPWRVQTEGTLGLSGELTASLDSHSDQIDLAIGDETITLTKLSVQLDGWVDEYQAQWQTRVDAMDLPPARVMGNGNGNLDSLEITNGNIVMADSSASMRGDVEWLPEIRWLLDLETEALNPALVRADLPGSLDGTLSMSGRVQPEGLFLDLSDIALDGELRGQPLKVSGNVSMDPRQWRLTSVRASSQQNSIAIEGTFGDRLSFSYDVNARNLAPFGEGWSGAITGNGRVGGTLEDPNLDADLTVADLNIASVSVGRAMIRGRIAASGPASDLNIEADEVRVDEQTVESLRIAVHGILEDHRVSIALETNGLGVEARMRGGWADDRWTGELLESHVRTERFGSWTQIDPSPLKLSQEHVETGPLCWHEQGSTACVEGSATAAVLDIDAQLDNLDLGGFGDLLPEGISASGLANMRANVNGSPAEPSLVFSADAPSVVLIYDFDPNKERIESTIRELKISGNADRRRIEMDLALASSRDGQFAFDGTLTDWQSPDRAIDAALKASLPDASFLAALTTEVSDFEASLQADLALTGLLSAPTMRGSVVMQQGHADIPRAGITLEDLRIEAKPAGLHRVLITGSARSGDGSIEASGHLDLDAEAGWPVSADIRGDNFQAIDLQGFDIAVSPDLQVSGSAHTLTLSGKVLTPRAIIELRELPEQAVEPSPDVTVYRSEVSAPVKRSVLKVFADLDLVLGDNVSFTGFGLTTALAGALAIHSEPGREPSGRGIVDITSGKFEAYGQELDITRGRLIFSGALDNPTLDVEATRQVNEITVGLRLSGSAIEPIAAVFSDPAMSETDALSYLVVGRSLSESSAEEGGDVSNAAAALGLKQVLARTSGVGEAVGLDEFGLDTENTGTGAVMAGKQITPDLRLRYSYGLFNRIGALLLHYRLNSRLSLEARSSEDQSLDLIYSHEKK